MMLIFHLRSKFYIFSFSVNSKTKSQNSKAFRNKMQVEQIHLLLKLGSFFVSACEVNSS